MAEHERYRAGFGQVATILGKDRAHFASGAVAIVGQGLDDHCNAARAVTLVADFVVIFGVGALRFLDCPLDIILRHVLGPRCKHGRPQPGIEGWIGQTELGRDSYFPCELAEKLGARLILAALAMHDVFELGMTGHKKRARLGMPGGYISRPFAKINIAERNRKNTSAP